MYMYVIHIWHARIHGKFCQGGGSMPYCQTTVLKTFFAVVLLFFNLYTVYRGFLMVISKKTIIFQGLKGSNIFQGLSNFFQGGGGGKVLISIETYITCDCAVAQTVFIVEIADLIFKVPSHSGEFTSGRACACSDYCISCPCSSFRLYYFQFLCTY